MNKCTFITAALTAMLVVLGSEQASHAFGHRSSGRAVSVNSVRIASHGGCYGGANFNSLSYGGCYGGCYSNVAIQSVAYVAPVIIAPLVVVPTYVAPAYVPTCVAPQAVQPMPYAQADTYQAPQATYQAQATTYSAPTYQVQAQAYQTQTYVAQSPVVVRQRILAADCDHGCHNYATTLPSSRVVVNNVNVSRARVVEHDRVRVLNSRQSVTVNSRTRIRVR